MVWSNFYWEMIGRNIGILSLTQQETLRQSCVAVAGCGGVGGIIAEQLARFGVGTLNIADPDCFETSNLNRQSCSTTNSLGHNKARTLASYLRLINPELGVRESADGIHDDNVRGFLSDAAIAVDAIDYRRLYDSITLHRQAREQGICTISPQAVGFGASVLVFGPNTDCLEDYIGIGVDASREEIEHFSTPITKFCPYMPSYADMSLVERIVSGEADIPTVAVGPNLSAAIAVGEAISLLTGIADQPAGPAPRAYTLDLLDRKFDVTG